MWAIWKKKALTEFSSQQMLCNIYQIIITYVFIQTDLKAMARSENQNIWVNLEK